MPSFTPVADLDALNLSNDWIDSPKFDSRDREVDHEGRKYRLVAKKERQFSTFERIKNIFLAVLAIIATLGIALCLPSIRALLLGTKETKRFGVECNNAIVKSEAVQKTLTSLNNGLVIHQVGDFSSPKITLKINGELVQCHDILGRKEHKISDLSVLEEPMQDMLGIIAQEMQEREEIVVNLTVSLTDSKGNHEFYFNFLKRPGVVGSNGGLFGEPGYSFNDPNFDLSDVDLSNIFSSF